MTALEKQAKVKDVLIQMCKDMFTCKECAFWDEKGDCMIRDIEKNMPCDEVWDMNSAMISD
ncbi:hypothetical protein D3Z36_15930 [Lachnospiraceae bacterium]|nr:hypothetical protein [Lachnospiraceae bacterium]